MNRNDIQNKLDKARIQRQNLDAEIEKLENELRKVDPYTADIAVEIHNKTCHWNHTDGCSWYYEMKKGQHDWNGDTHTRYFKRAEKLVRFCEGWKITPEVAFEIQDIMQKDK